MSGRINFENPCRDLMVTILYFLYVVPTAVVATPSVVADVAACIGCNILRVYELRRRGVILPHLSFSDSNAILTFMGRRA
jgi:hypothetical protein